LRGQGVESCKIMFLGVLPIHFFTFAVGYIRLPRYSSSQKDGQTNDSIVSVADQTAKNGQ